jgi:threonyl-tRNA synthetase
MMKEAKTRDHQKLFWFSPLSPGSPFFLPHGTRIFNAIQSMLREQYWERGYDEVHSPLMYDVQLWKTSGHWQHYQDDMFRVPLKNTAAPSAPGNASEADGGNTSSLEKERLFALKPMNCPGHCLTVVFLSSANFSISRLPHKKSYNVNLSLQPHLI